MGTLAEYETALKQDFLQQHFSNDPGTEDRLIEVVVNDGANNSNVAAALISVTADQRRSGHHSRSRIRSRMSRNAAAVVLAPSATLS